MGGNVSILETTRRSKRGANAKESTDVMNQPRRWQLFIDYKMKTTKSRGGFAHLLIIIIICNYSRAITGNLETTFTFLLQFCIGAGTKESKQKSWAFKRSNETTANICCGNWDCCDQTLKQVPAIRCCSVFQSGIDNDSANSFVRSLSSSVPARNWVNYFCIKNR